MVPIEIYRCAHAENLPLPGDGIAASAGVDLWAVAKALAERERGAGGFGSTGR